jgi:hypothetical protein
VVQVDEPLLAAVLAGELPTASGWGRLPRYEPNVVEDGLRQVLAAAAGPAQSGGASSGETVSDGDAEGNLAGVWIGATRLDGALLQAAGAGFIGLDGAVLDTVDEDEIGEAVDAGVGLLVGSVPLEAREKDPRPAMAPLQSLWKRLGFTPELLPRVVALTPVEGLERLAADRVPGVLRRAVEAARYLEESAAEEES